MTRTKAKVYLLSMFALGTIFGTTVAAYIPYFIDFSQWSEMRPTVSAMKNGDYVRAAKLVQPLAENGNHHAQRLYGQLLAMGVGSNQNSALAEIFMRRGECRCDPGGPELGVAINYRDGLLVDQNHEEYIKWLQKSAEVGNSKAAELLRATIKERRQ